MDEKKFKKEFKPPACTRAPWEHLITGPNKENIMRQIRQETIALYGESLDECPKRKVCFTKACIGRPLPWKSPTAKPYLDQLKATHTITNDELYLSNCDTCVIASYCTSSCSQVNDFLQRDKTDEPEMLYKESLDNITVEDVKSDAFVTVFGKGFTPPWDSLTPRRAMVVKKYLYENKDFLNVAKELGLYDQSKAKYEFYAALTTLSEYAVMRRWIKDNPEANGVEVLHKIYNENKTMIQVAKELSVSKQAVQQTVSRLIKANKLTWNVFVKKQGNKVVYNVPETLR